MKHWLWLFFGAALTLTVGCDAAAPEQDAGLDADDQVDIDADVDADVEDSGGADVDEAIDAEAPTDAEESDADVAQGEYFTLANEVPCSGENRAIHASPGEEGHLLAVRLTPESYPATLSRVRYRLIPDPEPCSAALPHRVEVSVSKDAAPDATPTAIVIAEESGTFEGNVERIVTHVFDEPLTLEEGDHLFIAVEMVADGEGNRLCVNACINEAAESDRNYWSNSATVPYPWVTLDTFGLKLNAEIWAAGTTRE